MAAALKCASTSCLYSYLYIPECIFLSAFYFICLFCGFYCCAFVCIKFRRPFHCYSFVNIFLLLLYFFLLLLLYTFLLWFCYTFLLPLYISLVVFSKKCLLWTFALFIFLNLHSFVFCLPWFLLISIGFILFSIKCCFCNCGCNWIDWI